MSDVWKAYQKLNRYANVYFSFFVRILIGVLGHSLRLSSSVYISEFQFQLQFSFCNRYCPIISCGITFNSNFRWLVFVNLTHPRVLWEERPSVEKLPPSDWPVDVSVGPFLLLIVIAGSSPPWEIPGQVDLESIKQK